MSSQLHLYDNSVYNECEKHIQLKGLLLSYKCTNLVDSHLHVRVYVLLEIDLVNILMVFTDSVDNVTTTDLSRMVLFLCTQIGYCTVSVNCTFSEEFSINTSTPAIIQQLSVFCWVFLL